MSCAFCQLQMRKAALGRQLDVLDANGTNMTDPTYCAINADYESVTDRIWDMEDATVKMLPALL